jgi:hypothetical protein
MPRRWPTVDRAQVLTGRLVDQSTPVQRDACAEEPLASFVGSDEADVLAVGLVGGTQTEPSSLVAHLHLGHVTHREQSASQLGLAQHGQHVGLVLQRIGAAAQPVPAIRGLYPPGVMTGGHGVETQGTGPVDQPVELQMPVAFDARIGGPPLRVTEHVGADHALFELGSEVEHVVDQPQLIGHPPGVLHIGHRAASRLRRAPPELEGGPDHPVGAEALSQQGRRH